MSEKEEFTEEVEELKDLETEAEEKDEAVSEIERKSPTSPIAIAMNGNNCKNIVRKI